MKWIDVLWPMMASACLTLGVINLLIWMRQRSRPEYLAFFVVAASVAGFAAGDWMLLRATEPQRYGEVLRWMHVVIFTGEISIATFVRIYLRAGRTWLFWGFCAARVIATALNFLYGSSINFLEVTGLRQVELWGGEIAAIPVGILNPLEAFEEFTGLLLAVFMADATRSAWRRGDPASRRDAITVGGSFIVFFVVAAGQAALMHRGIVHFPHLVTVSFMIVVAVQSHELGQHVLRTAQLAGELQASERRMDLAAGGANLGFWEWHIAHDDVWMTDRGRALFGFGSEPSRGLEGFLERVHPDDRAAVREAVARAVNGALGYEQEYRIALPDGSVRWVATRGGVERDSQGRPVLMRGVVFDITERRNAEVRTRRLESEAEARRNEIVHLSRVTTLGELSGALAHELNQPLAAILSNAQAAQLLLEREPIARAQLAEILAAIVASDRRASAVIERIRALFRKDAPRRESLDLNGLVSDTLDIVRVDLQRRGVTWQTELADPLPRVAGDRVQLQQVLLNLIVNACDAMSAHGGPRPLVVRTDAAEDGSVRVRLTDAGAGIPEADLERVFEPFVTTKRHGLGLGLAVCKTIVEAHDGRLWASNEAGAGATFHLTLPSIAG